MAAVPWPVVCQEEQIDSVGVGAVRGWQLGVEQQAASNGDGGQDATLSYGDTAGSPIEYRRKIGGFRVQD